MALSNDEFILLGTAHVTDDVVIHELTHSTLYGIFPTWFEDGYAYYIHHHLTGTIEEGVTRFEDGLVVLDADRRLDLGPNRSDEYQYYIDQARGYLFIKVLVDLDGLDEVFATVRALRTKTFTDQQLLKHLITVADRERAAAFRNYVCREVLRTIHDYCSYVELASRLDFAFF